MFFEKINYGTLKLHMTSITDVDSSPIQAL